MLRMDGFKGGEVSVQRRLIAVRLSFTAHVGINKYLNAGRCDYDTVTKAALSLTSGFNLVRLLSLCFPFLMWILKDLVTVPPHPSGRGDDTEQILCCFI